MLCYLWHDHKKELDMLYVKLFLLFDFTSYMSYLGIAHVLLFLFIHLLLHALEEAGY